MDKKNQEKEISKKESLFLKQLLKEMEERGYLLSYDFHTALKQNEPQQNA